MGNIVISLFLLGALYLASRALGLWGFILGCLLVLGVWQMIRSYGTQVVSNPLLHDGAFAEGWLVGIPLFALAAMWRLFFWYEIQVIEHCSRCGYQKPAKE